MDASKRLMLQNALTFAASNDALIAIERTDGSVSVVRRDITCYEDYIEATDRDGQPVIFSYADIEGVSVS